MKKIYYIVTKIFNYKKNIYNICIRGTNKCIKLERIEKFNGVFIKLIIQNTPDINQAGPHFKKLAS